MSQSHSSVDSGPGDNLERSSVSSTDPETGERRGEREGREKERGGGVSVPICMHKAVHMACVWRPEADVTCLSHLLSTTFLEGICHYIWNSLTELRLAGQGAARIYLPGAAPAVLASQAQPCPQLFHRCWRSSLLQSKRFTIGASVAGHLDTDAHLLCVQKKTGLVPDALDIIAARIDHKRLESRPPTCMVSLSLVHVYISPSLGYPINLGVSHCGERSREMPNKTQHHGGALANYTHTVTKACLSPLHFSHLC